MRLLKTVESAAESHHHQISLLPHFMIMRRGRCISIAHDRWNNDSRGWPVLITRAGFLIVADRQRKNKEKTGVEIEEGSASTGGNRGPRLIALPIVYTIDSSTSFVFFHLPICSFFVFPFFFLCFLLFFVPFFCLFQLQLCRWTVQILSILKCHALSLSLLKLNVISMAVTKSRTIAMRHSYRRFSFVISYKASWCKFARRILLSLHNYACLWIFNYL